MLALATNPTGHTCLTFPAASGMEVSSCTMKFKARYVANFKVRVRALGEKGKCREGLLFVLFVHFI